MFIVLWSVFVASNFNSYKQKKNEISTGRLYRNKPALLKADVKNHTINKIIDLISEGKFNVAEAEIRKTLINFPNSIKILQLHGLVLSNQKKYEKALPIFERILSLAPHLASSFSNYGLSLENNGMISAAIEVYQQGLIVEPNSPTLNHNLGVAFAKIGNEREAINFYKSALQQNPQSPEVLNNMGKALKNLREFEQALNCFTLAIKFNPNYFEAKFNKAVLYKEQKNIIAAKKIFEEISAKQPENLFYLLNLGLCEVELGEFSKAEKIFNSALKENPESPEVFMALGSLKRNLGEISDAIKYLERAILINDKLADAHSLLALCYQVRNDPEKAELLFKKAVDLSPNSSNFLNNLGQFYFDCQRFDLAFQTYLKAHKYALPDTRVVSSLYFTAANMCDWAQTSVIEKTFPDFGILENEYVNPFVMLQFEDNPEKQYLRALNCGRQYTRKVSSRKFENKSVSKKAKIKIAYLSADFHNHATMRLMSGLLRNHDKSKFDILLFNYGHSAFDEQTSLAKKYSSEFYDIAKKSDQQIVDLIKGMNIDIAIDLKGYTKDTRSHLFSYRLAPIQINYLGYPNTMGVEFIDYIVADKIIIPEECQSFYSEKIIYMPDSYQPNDNERQIFNSGMSRMDIGLPEDKFIMACMNTNYKITSKEFEVWFSILQEIDNSMLVLLATNKWAVENIYSAAKRKGIDKERIKFMPKVAYEKHLERLKLMDVFVDTFRVNAHTSASDALWAGIPVVTLIGQQFAARVAASLLNATGMNEFIANNIDQYKEKIIKLGTDKAFLYQIKRKIENNKYSAPLFDTQKYTHDFEKLLTMVLDNYKAGKKIQNVSL